MRRKKVLLVDDSRAALRVQAEILSGARYEVLTARDGEEALARALEERPDLILLDDTMPKMGGLEACRRLRQEQATQAIPIILVTLEGRSQSVEAAFESGCNDFLTKPIDEAELLTKLRVYLGE